MKPIYSILIIAGIFYSGLISFITKSLIDESDKYSVNIGKKVLVDKDTLTVVDYSTFFQRYTLSNGKKVSREFIIKQLK